MNELLLWLTGLPIALWLAGRGYRRALLSRAKHPSLRGHARLSRRVARLIPFYEFDEDDFFRADGAPEPVAARRRTAFERLEAYFAARSPKSIALLENLADSVSDLQFIGRYRVPFPFSRRVRNRLKSAIIAESAAGHSIFDLDGNAFIDLTGAYGVNLLGTDCYKRCIAEGSERVRDLGPVLGPYHPVVTENVERLKAVSGLDEVSFHMSGTEAVMQAVRLARYHTGRSHIVRFCGAYHGWWDEVQPGIGNPGPPGRVYTLCEMSEAAIRVLETRRDIACVLVNPLQALHPNGSAPGDGSLVASDRSAHFDRTGYSAWLQRLEQTCRKRGILLILDEIFVGFRIARGGAQEFFDIRADMVTYGKTVGGGLPVGVLCGRHDVMKRYRDDQPVDICFARGTFNTHPYVMGAMNAFFEEFDSEPVRALYEDLDMCWNARAARLNKALSAGGVPVSIANFSSIFTVVYKQPSRYNWMYQFYLNAEGLLLPWVGTGRLIFPLNFGEDDFDEVITRMVAAGRTMSGDGWWEAPSGLDNASIRRSVLREMLRARLHRRRVVRPAL